MAGDKKKFIAALYARFVCIECLRFFQANNPGFNREIRQCYECYGCYECATSIACIGCRRLFRANNPGFNREIGQCYECFCEEVMGESND